MKRTGAAILVSRGIKVLQAAPAAYPYRYAACRLFVRRREIMDIVSENETWLVDIGDAVIRKEARNGADSLLPWEKLVHCLWVADYGMRNAGDLDTAEDVYAPFQSEGMRLATELSLPVTREAFSLSKNDLENQYFDRFESICEEIKGAKPQDAVELPKRRARKKHE